MDRIEKVLRKLSFVDKQAVTATMLKIKHNILSGLDIKKIVGTKDIYRARQGKIRILFQRTDKGNVLIAVEKRSEKTYREL